MLHKYEIIWIISSNEVSEDSTMHADGKIHIW